VRRVPEREPRPRADDPAALPFVGRDPERRALDLALDDAARGATRVVLLSGEAGIGKTRLVEETLAAAAASGIGCAVGRCHEGDGAPPFWPWTQVLRRLARDGDADGALAAVADDVARAVPGPARRGRGPLPTEAGDARFRIFAAIADALRRASGAAPRAVVLEDVHWADVPSLLLLQFVARELRDAPLLVVATYRDVPAEHPAARPLGTIAREASARRIALGGLDADAIGRLVAAATAAEPAAAWCSDLARRTGGNPFFLCELLRFAGSDGVERFAPDRPLPFLPEVSALVEQHLEQVSPACRDLLRVASVLGEDFALDLLREVAGLDVADALRRLDEASAARLVVEHGAAGRFAFTHALVRDALYASLSLAQRVETHSRIADALEARHPEPTGEALAELAHHFVAAAAADGGDERAVRYARRAGEWAMARLAYEDAAHRFRQALDLLAQRGTPDARERAALLLALAQAHWYAGDLERARAVCEEVAALADALGDPALLLESVLHSGRWWGVRGIHPDPVQIMRLESGLAALPPEDSELRALSTATLAWDLYGAGELERGERLAREATAIARRLGDPQVQLHCLRAQLVASLGPHQARDRLAISTEMVALARAVGDLEMACLAGRWRCLNLFELGNVGEMQQELDVATKLAQRLSQPSLDLYVRGVVTLRQILTGDLAAADAALHEMLDAATGLGGRDVIGVQLALLRVVQGRWDDARAIFELIRAQLGRFPALGAATILTDAEAGRLDDARSALDALAAQGFADLPRDFLWLHGVVLLAMACRRLDDRTRAARLHELLSPFAELNVVANPGGWFCWGSAHGPLGALAATLGRDAEAEHHLEHAVRENQRLGVRVWALYWQGELATLRRARGAADAAELLARVAAAADEVGMPHVASRARAALAERAAPAASAAGADVAATASTAALRDAVARDRAVLRRDGDFWTVAYAGEERRIRDVKGLHYIAHLIRNAGREMHALDLAALVGGSESGDGAGAAADAGGDSGPLLDARAKAAYRRRLADLADELEEAERNGDPGRAGRARVEIEALTEQLASAVGLGGRDRRAGAAAERARSAVTWSIRSAIKRLDAELPRLGARLRASVHTGAFCSYEPDLDRPIDWTL